MCVWVPFCVVLPRVYSDSLCGSILSAGSRSELRGVDTRLFEVRRVLLGHRPFDFLNRIFGSHSPPLWSPVRSFNLWDRFLQNRHLCFYLVLERRSHQCRSRGLIHRPFFTNYDIFPLAAETTLLDLWTQVCLQEKDLDQLALSITNCPTSMADCICLWKNIIIISSMRERIMKLTISICFFNSSLVA